MGRTPAGQTREKVFRFVRDRLAGGRPPTVREVMEAFGFRSPQTAREHLDALIEDGRLRKEPKVARGFRLPGRGEAPTVMVPSPPAHSIWRSKISKGTSPCRRAARPASCSACACAATA
jgi:SOS-response transcriptional repressor LexA